MDHTAKDVAELSRRAGLGATRNVLFWRTRCGFVSAHIDSDVPGGRRDIKLSSYLNETGVSIFVQTGAPSFITNTDDPEPLYRPAS